VSSRHLGALPPAFRVFASRSASRRVRVCGTTVGLGAIVLGEVGHRDFYGNYVPSRHEVEPGTKGSVEYAQRVNGEPND